MILYAIVDRNTGRIKVNGRCPNRSYENMVHGDDEAIVKCNISGKDIRVNPDTLDDEQIEFILRDTFPNDFDKVIIEPDGVDAATLTGLPDPCVITIDGEENNIAGGSLVLKSDVPGTWLVSLDVLEYKPRDWRIVAND